MKKIYLPLIFLAILCLSSCVDIEEQYDFKADGSCNVVYGFDMSKAVSVLVNLMSDSVKETPQFSLVKDTTLNFYSAMPDSTQQKMSIEETNMAKTSDLSINMNLKKSIMKVNITHVAKNAADLQYYLQNLSKIALNSRINAFASADKASKSFDARQMVAGQDYYSYDITPHKFYRIIDKVKFNAFLKKTQSTFMMAKAMLIDMPYKVILKFAKPVKKLNNPKAVLSADRRSVTLVTSMDEVIKNPAVMNLKIDF
ncbi:hypothetical protein [Mucilaginibacter lappiensis]|uniref:Uncharacterized protein n=1 Tax=Mucilaginibacter lappiensis TaxID=354630 RepID=A0A841J8Z7_9SPHI|nr:hypothetical protein [Mucilaginibacter lappiensis]MBB6127649.1 hypothetical protein [Mucilaginibacter lappiensis]